MTGEEFTWWLLAIFLGVLALLALIILHERANPNPSELNQVLMRNGGDDDQDSI